MSSADPSDDIAQVVMLSLFVSATAVTLSALVGIPVGAWLGLARFRGKRAVLGIVNAGMGLPPVVVGLVVYLLLSHDGPLGFLDWLFTPSAMVLAQVILCLPLVIGIVESAISTTPPDLALQLASLGADRTQIRMALLRQARSGIVLALAAACGRSASEVGAVLMVGGNIKGHTRVLTTAIVLEAGQGHVHTALILGAFVMTLTLIVNVAIIRLRGTAAS